MFHVKLDPRGFPHQGGQSAEEALRRYAHLLELHGKRLGLLSSSDLDNVWERHVLDSLRALACVPPNTPVLADIGSGGGLPGIPLAIALPQTVVVLVESRSRKVGFLEMAVADLGLTNVTVRPERAENLTVIANVCTARAVGDPQASWRLADPLLVPTGSLVYFGGGALARRLRDGEAGSVRGVPPELLGLNRGLAVEICLPSHFEWQGPLVIIRRMPTHAPPIEPPLPKPPSQLVDKETPHGS